MLEKSISETRAYYCLECGICTGSCPVSRRHPQYSPRIMVERALLDDDESMLSERESWDCLTCGTCSARCPSTVDFNEFTRALRTKARESGFAGTDTHAGVLRAVMELETARTEPRDDSWLAADAKVSRRSKTYFYTGCLPYYSVVFRDLCVDTAGMANSALRLMNACGVRPAISRSERCCGHDLYWTGDDSAIAALARENVAAIKETGASTVVFACPECQAMFAQVYPGYCRNMPFRTMHITQFLAEQAAAGRLSLGQLDIKATLHDPCRLGRFQGVYEQPRELLKSVPGVELTEMPRNRSEALCCGSSAWVGCTRVNKSIQLERLAEARDTGASTLVTACPKCNIHLSCAARDGDVQGAVQIRFVTDLLAEALAAEVLQEGRRKQEGQETSNGE